MRTHSNDLAVTPYSPFDINKMYVYYLNKPPITSFTNPVSTHKLLISITLIYIAHIAIY